MGLPAFAAAGIEKLGGSGRHLQPPRLSRESYTQCGRPDPFLRLANDGAEGEAAARECSQTGRFGYANERPAACLENESTDPICGW